MRKTMVVIKQDLATHDGLPRALKEFLEYAPLNLSAVGVNGLYRNLGIEGAIEICNHEIEEFIKQNGIPGSC